MEEQKGGTGTTSFHGATYLTYENMSRQCGLLGERLFRACVEHTLSVGITVDPHPLIREWELDIRIPLAKRGPEMNVIEMQTLYDAMNVIHRTLDKE